MFHMKHERKIVHSYVETKIDYRSIALSIYKKFKEEEAHENEVDESKDS